MMKWCTKIMLLAQGYISNVKAKISPKRPGIKVYAPNHCITYNWFITVALKLFVLF